LVDWTKESPLGVNSNLRNTPSLDDSFLFTTQPSSAPTFKGEAKSIRERARELKTNEKKLMITSSLIKKKEEEKATLRVTSFLPEKPAISAVKFSFTSEPSALLVNTTFSLMRTFRKKKKHQI